jgi:hypothetical protein
MALNTLQQTYGAPPMQVGQKHDTTTAPSGPYGHGVGGLFSMPGQDARIFSAMLQPVNTILNDLPVLTADPIPGAGYGGYQQEFFTTVTGVTASQQTDANQPTAECSPFPEGGLLKVCTLVSPYGRYGASLPTLNLETLGMLANPADPTYLQLMNMAQPDAGPSLPGGMQGILYNEFTKRAFTAVHGYAQYVSRKIWNGDPALSAASNRWRDVLGLNTQINAGNKRDAISNTLCTAMDSDVKDFGYQQITGTVNDIVRYMDMMFAYLNWNASQAGMGNVRWKIYMRPQLFDEIAKIWPIRYYQEAMLQVNNFTNARFNFGSEVADLRDRMRAEAFIPLRGMRVEVGLDEGIAERNSTTNAQLTPGQFASDIYFVPLTVLGGVPVTYLEPFNQANAITEAVIREGRVLNTFTSDGGQYRWYTRQTDNCVSWSFVSQFRIVVRTPQLAGRITNVAYAPLQHFRSAYNDEVSYFSNGGRTNNPVTPSYYSEWSATPVQVT